VPDLVRAVGLGTLAQSSLLAAGLLVCWVRVPRKLVGLIAGFGAGALVSAIAFDLVGEAERLGPWESSIWMLAGVAIFLGGDRLVDKRYGTAGTAGAMGIVVGSVVDGVPESVIFGSQVAGGVAVSASLLAAVVVSNVPQALAPSSDLVRLWLGVVAACAVASAVGFLAGSGASDANSARLAAIAAGGLLGMLTDSLMPFAFDRGGELAGLATVLGFCFALGIS
jgi:ZIP family zinc transporter